MTIAERFAKFTTQELKDALLRLEAQEEKDARTMEHFKDQCDKELYQMAVKQWNETVNLLVDVKCAYEARKDK